MSTSRQLPIGTAIAMLTLAGCAAPPPAPTLAELPAGSPDACQSATIESATPLQLRPTRHADGSFLQRIDVNRNLARGARWREVGEWSVLSYTVQSAGAASLAVHLSGLQLPARSEVWWCAPDGRLRHGPYRDVAGGALWTPVVDGERGLLQVWVPTALRSSFAGTLADAQGG